METFLGILGCAAVAVVLGLAAVGLIAVLGMKTYLRNNRITQADRQVADVGRAAQMAILQEALRRATPSSDRAKDGGGRP